MKDTHRIWLVVSILSAFFVSGMVTAAPVFKVSKGDDIIYIAGTFHLLTEKDYPLPSAFEVAYEAADKVFFETDIKALSSSKFQSKSIAVITYQDDNTLQTSLNEKTYQRLDKYAQSRGLSMQQLAPFTPTGVMLTITIMEYQARGFVAEGVDAHYYDKAVEDSKAIGWFETPDEQLAILDSFDNDDPNGLVNYTLDEIDTIDQVINDLHSSWRSGNMSRLVEIGIDGFQDYPQIYQDVLVKRNNNWLINIEAMFGNDSTELILVGALHLPGADGILTQLEQKGFVVEKL